MISDYGANLFNGLIHGNRTSPPLPTTYYLGLSTTTPLANGTGFTEPSTVGSAYARIPISNASTQFTAPVLGMVSNILDLQFPESTANWGTITHGGLFDTATGGTFIEAGELQVQKTVESGTILIVKAGQMQITIGN